MSTSLGSTAPKGYGSLYHLDLPEAFAIVNRGKTEILRMVWLTADLKGISKRFVE
jgi:hypothetical protein